MANSRLEIDLSAIERNLAVVRRVIDAAKPGRVQVCGVIKQDAYGLGAARVAKKLASAGIDTLAVYSLDEARALADVPIRTPLMVLSPVSLIERNDPLYRLLVGGRLHMVLHSEQQAMDLSTLGVRIGVQFPVHVQVDTGMSRGGCLPDEAARLVELATSPGAAGRLRLAGVMTHFSSPAHDESFTKEQARLFRSWIDRIKPLLSRANERGYPPCLVHAANTAATFRSASLHATMVRVGQGLYGYGPEALPIGEDSGVEFTGQAMRLEHAMRWVSRIAHVQDIPAGWPVGYGRTWHAKRPSRIALVPVGYAQGYPIGLSSRGHVRLTGVLWDRPRTSAPEDLIAPRETDHGAFAPVVGRVSMDQITIDVTDAPPEAARVGAEVELVGRRLEWRNSLPRLAALAGTIPHQFLCGITGGVERAYVLSGVESEPTLGQGPAAVALAERLRAAV